MTFTITLKNLAGDLIPLSYDKENDTFWDFKLKIQTLFLLNDIWRINLFKNYEIIDEDIWYNSIKDGDVIDCFISDDTCLKIEIKLNRILYTSNNEMCSQYGVFLNIDDNNYDYIFYSIERNSKLFFLSEDNSSIHNHYNNHNAMEISILYIKEEDEIYTDIKSLFLNNKNIPIIQRERIVNNIVDKWNKEIKNYQDRLYDICNNSM